MGLIYGNMAPLIEEAILEQEFLNEMMFSKKDLQDPKIVEKIYKTKFLQYDNVLFTKAAVYRKVHLYKTQQNK